MQIQAALILLIGVCAWGQPDPASLAQLYEENLAAQEARFGPNHPKVARAANRLGLFLRNYGRKPDAERHIRRALAIDEASTGKNSAVVAEDLENLVSVLDAREAAPLVVRLSRWEQPAVAARNLAKLGALEEARNNRDGALALYREALKKEEAAHGLTHPRVAVRLNDVALLLDPKEAEPLLRRALVIQEKSGRKDPEIAATLNNLANVLLATGRIPQAEPLAKRGLAILEESLGPAHPRVATACSNLADIARGRKDYATAQRLYERALAIDETAYGPRHPEVAVDLENLAELLEEMGTAAKARPLRERAAAIKAGAR